MPSLLVLFLISVVAIIALAILIRWLHPTSKSPITTEIFQQQLHQYGAFDQIRQILLSTSGKEAIAALHDNGQFAVLRALGDRYAIRVVDGNQIDQKGTIISIADYTWPRFNLSADNNEVLRQWLKANKGKANA